MIRNSECPGVAWSAVLAGAEFMQTVWKTRMLGTERLASELQRCDGVYTMET